MNNNYTLFLKIIFALVSLSFSASTKLQAQACSGMPSPGNTLATSTNPCPGTVDTLSLQNFSSLGTGVTYQWMQGAAPITGATNAIYVTILGGPSATYSCNVTCVASGSTAGSVPITLTAASWMNCYCESRSTSPVDEEIYKVTLNGVSTNALYSLANGCTNVAPGPGSILSEYSNFKTLPVLSTLIQGINAPFMITQNECDGAPYFSNRIGIWIDFNHNASFSDPGEQVFIESTSVIGPRTISGTFVVPLTSLTGNTVMRVVCTEGFTPTPCGLYGYGETEDYLVGVVPFNQCSGTPTPGNTVASATTVCSGSNVSFSLQNTTPGFSVLYQWYNNGGAIAGATQSTYSTSLSASNTYYCAVTCSASSQTANSVPITVNVNALSSGSSSATGCSPYVWNGNTFTTSGVYTGTFMNALGCDSIHTLTLTLNSSLPNVFSQTACDSYSWSLSGNTYTSSGNYTVTYLNTAGCDSNSILNLLINYSSLSSANLSFCDSVIVGGQTYTASGTYTQTLTNVSGCDSIVTLNATIHTSSSTTINQTGCDSITYNGQTYTVSGTYTGTYTSASGCDSILTLNIALNYMNLLTTLSGTTITANAPGLTYQWIDCNTNAAIPGATNQSYTATANGNYAVILSAGLCFDTTTCVTVNALGLYEINKSASNYLYPNPNTGQFSIHLLNDAEIIITNAMGENVYTQKLSKGLHEIDLSNKAAGIYFLKIIADGKYEIIKVMKEK